MFSALLEKLKHTLIAKKFPEDANPGVQETAGIYVADTEMLRDAGIR